MFLCLSLSVFFIFVPISIAVIGGIEKAVYCGSVTSFVLCLSLSVFVFVCVCLCLFFVFVPISIVKIGGEGGILLQRDLTKAVSPRPHRHTSRKKGKARQQKKIRERKCDEKHH